MNTPAPTTTPAHALVHQADPSVTGKQLRRLRWAVRAALTLGMAASIAANVLHARPNPISQIIAAWPPLALLLTVELISRVPQHRRSLGIIRVAATVVVAAIAGWVSYWHLVGVAARYGETGYGAAYLLPISVDGLVIVASVSLVEIAARIRATEPAPAAPAAATAPSTVAVPAPPAPSARAMPAADPSLVPDAPSLTTMATTTDPATAAVAAIDDRPATAAPAAGRDDGRQDAPADDGPDMGIPVPDTVSPPAPGGRAPSEDTDEATQAPPPRPADAPQPPSVDSDGRERADPPDAAPADDVPTGTAAAVIYWRRRDPTLHPAEIATRIGKSERTVRRYWPTPARNGAPRGNGRLTHSLRR